MTKPGNLTKGCRCHMDEVLIAVLKYLLNLKKINFNNFLCNMQIVWKKKKIMECKF